MKLNASLLLLGAASLAACTPSFAAGIVNGGFEDACVGSASSPNCTTLSPIAGSGVPVNAAAGTNTLYPYGVYSGWTLTGGADGNTYISVDINNYPAHSGFYSASFGGVTGTISQTVSDSAGTSADLIYYLASADADGTPSSFYASINGVEQSASLISTPGDFAYEEFMLPFTETGSDTVSFTGAETDGEFELDDVSIAPLATVAATPEPSSLMLLGTGVLGLAGAARRRWLRA